MRTSHLASLSFVGTVFALGGCGYIGDLAIDEKGDASTGPRASTACTIEFDPYATAYSESGGEWCRFDSSSWSYFDGQILTGYAASGVANYYVDPDIGRLYKLEGEESGVGSEKAPVADGAAESYSVPFSFEGENPFNCNLDRTGEGGVTVDCNGKYAMDVRITDYGGSCEKLVQPKVSFSCAGIESERRATTRPSDCQAGSGRFALMVSHYYDTNLDGSHTATLVPLQISGTGVLTNHAWVNTISAVDDDGFDLRVMMVDNPVMLSATDQLLNPSTSSLSLATDLLLTSGQVSGYPAFVVEGWSRESGLSMVVDMSWTCSTDDVITVNRTRGYSIKASAMGCNVPQALTMRISPKELAWEPYGNPNVVIRTPTTDTVNGRKFTYTRGSLSVTGLVKQVTPSSAKVQLVSATVGGVSVCTPGLYTLTAE